MSVLGTNSSKLAPDGVQSELNYRFDLIEALPTFNLASILAYGAEKYGEGNWRKIPMREHLNRVHSHLEAFKLQQRGLLSQEDMDDHIGHAYCRLHFALTLYLEEASNGNRNLL